MFRLERRALKSMALASKRGLLVLMVLVLNVTFAQAQTLNFTSKDGKPIEITADNGIEWQQDRQVFVARGNAKALSGEATITADELRAYYKDKGAAGTGGTDIWRMDALGKVTIRSPQETVTGGKAVYDVENAILIVSGGTVRLVSGADTITADGQLEYWERKQMAVARGNARAVRGTRNLRADVLATYFKKTKNGGTKAYRIDAFDDVQIKTEKDRATADRGVYNVESGIATLTGSVNIIRGKNILKGCSADINLNTGLSNLHSCPKASQTGTQGRVSGVLRPTKK